MNAALTDRSILRALGLALARDEAGTARVVDSGELMVDRQAARADSRPTAGPARQESRPTATFILWRRCAWCQSVLGVIAVETPTPGMFSDTCCPECRAKYFRGVDSGELMVDSQRRAAA